MHNDKFPGMLSMHGAYSQFILCLDKQSPVAYINDIRGSMVDANIAIEQREDLSRLGQTQPWHTLFVVRALRDILAGEELVVRTISYLLLFRIYILFSLVVLR